MHKFPVYRPPGSSARKKQWRGAPSVPKSGTLGAKTAQNAPRVPLFGTPGAPHPQDTQKKAAAAALVVPRAGAK